MKKTISDLKLEDSLQIRDSKTRPEGIFSEFQGDNEITGINNNDTLKKVLTKNKKKNNSSVSNRNSWLLSLLRILKNKPPKKYYKDLDFNKNILHIILECYRQKISKPVVIKILKIIHTRRLTARDLQMRLAANNINEKDFFDCCLQYIIENKMKIIKTIQWIYYGSFDYYCNVPHKTKAKKHQIKTMSLEDL